MVVAKQTYTIVATWTPAQLASAFRSAFIDAGLMTEWHSSFLSGAVENRVMEVTYNAGATYGKTYVWLMFTTTGVFFNTAGQWTASATAPSGTAGVDFTNSTTNAVSNHWQPFAMATGTTVTLTRYTSGINSNESWFLIRSAANSFIFSIDKGVAVESIIDLTKANYLPITRASFGSVTGGRYLDFAILTAAWRRNFLDSNNGYSWSNATLSFALSWRYMFKGDNVAWVNNVLDYPVYYLPLARTSSNPAFASDSTPLVTGVRVSLYTNRILPSDFGLMPYYASSSVAVQDRMIVTAGVEEWEVLGVINGNGSNLPGMLFVGRTV